MAAAVLRLGTCFALVSMLCLAALEAQSGATLRGRVLDASGAVLDGAAIRARHHSSIFDRTVTTDGEGRFEIVALPPGAYEVEARAAGFRTQVIDELAVEVGRTLVRDFRLDVGDISETIVVEGVPLIDRASTTVGHVVTAQTVREIPLNGRHFTDLGLLVPGSVAPTQKGFSATAIRGQGALAFNTAGNREEAVAFLVNGVTTNNLTFGSLSYQPPIGSVQEFKVDNSTFSAEYGHVSGAIVNIATRSGGNEFHGEAFEFLRDDAMDARNFFEFTSPEPHPFKRNQFGGAVGGPILPARTFFFVSYEGLRQRQGLDMNSLVLSEDQRAAATDPVIRRLIDLIPAANFVDSGGTPRFVGSAEAVVDIDRWTVDLRQNLGDNDRLHGYYGSQRIRSREPTSNGNSIPGFGHVGYGARGVFTLNETRIFGPGLVNEARFGRSTVAGTATPGAELNPLDHGISNGVTRPIGLPQIVVAGGLNFGGPANYPTGRDDTLFVVSDTTSHVRGRHSLRLGGEYRHFVNDNVDEGTGSFNFPSVAAFLAGNANAFSVTLGERRSHIVQRAFGLFAQDSISVRSNLTLELGLRYEWHMTPTEGDNRFVVFDAPTASLRRVGSNEDVYRQNNRNVEPRVGLAWDPWGDGRTSIRAAYALAVDQPSTTAVRGTTANPPMAVPLTASGTIRLDNAIAATRAAGLAPQTVDPRFTNASVSSWNLNLQRDLTPGLAAMAGYFGSRGAHMRISRNINQPINGTRPFAAVAPSSDVLPGAPLGNITQVESTGVASYHALWLSSRKRLSRGLQLDASYTWSKALDYNSLNSSGFEVQDSYDLPNQQGLSDFDARHRFVLSMIYELPFTGHALARGWQLAAIIQSQSGNPVNIVTSNSALTGVPNTVRPDLTGPIQTTGTVDQWFDTSSFAAVNRFGSLGRNVVIGPTFHNTDLSVSKLVRVGQRMSLRLRVDAFDLFNHANFGQPGNIVDSPTFGRITRTRFSTGEAGSSRQIQLGMILSF